jgi:hypothetical protein
MNAINAKQRVKIKPEVIVAGGGPGGCCAAIAAARNGARTLLIERYGFLGGMATAGLVNPFMTYFAGREQIIKGIFSEMLLKLDEKGALGKNRPEFDDEILRIVLDEMLIKAGVRVMFHTLVTGARTDRSRITGVEISNKSGNSVIGGKIFIDSTGDGDLSAFSGAPFELGRKKDGEVQPMTLCFRMAGVNMGKLPGKKELDRKYEAARKSGVIRCPRENMLWFCLPHRGTVHFNTTRVIHVNGTDADDLAAAEIEGRRQIAEISGFLKKNIPAFKNAYIQKIAAQIGVRETRRITGKYTLTEADVLSARKFNDGIAKGSYSIDIHNPVGKGTVWKSLKYGEWYHIPYRCLVPRKIRNLLVGSRCISATHEAHSSLRIMPVVCAIGEAAGTAAAICARQGSAPGEIDIDILQKTLTDQGACI